MKLTETQRLALIALKDGKKRTRHEVRRAANLTSLNGATLRALLDLRLVEVDDGLDGHPVWNITGAGKNVLGGGL